MCPPLALAPTAPAALAAQDLGRGSFAGAVLQLEFFRRTAGNTHACIFAGLQSSRVAGTRRPRRAPSPPPPTAHLLRPLCSGGPGAINPTAMRFTFKVLRRYRSGGSHYIEMDRDLVFAGKVVRWVSAVAKNMGRHICSAGDQRVSPPARPSLPCSQAWVERHAAAVPARH